MNISTLIEQQATIHPDKDAVRVPKRRFGKYTYDSITFRQFLDRSNSYAKGLMDNGITRGTKVLMFVKPGLDFPVLTFALFKIGAVPIFIDPGMGKDNLLKAVSDVKPEGLIAEPIVHVLRKFNKEAFSSIKYSFSVGNWNVFGAKSIKPFLGVKATIPETTFDKHELAAILFTSGGTGIPKGVEYTHNIFLEQTRLLQDMFNLTAEEVDVPGFPLFALFTLAMGMTSCIPDMNPSKPAKANPKKLVQNIIDNEGTFVAGSPAIWSKVSAYCVKNNIELPSVKYLVMFGAPVSPKVHEEFMQILPNGDTYTPYGATECLPVSCITGSDLLIGPVDLTRQGKGTCVGPSVPGVRVEIAPITDKEIHTIEEIEFLPENQMGEIIVTGPTVTRAYHGMPVKTREAKIYEGDEVWHRMGDLGYKDSEGNIWFCGRKSHRVTLSEEILSSVQCEAIFNNHPFVRRSALIGLGDDNNQTPAIVIEAKKGLNKSLLKKELTLLASAHPLTKKIKEIYFDDNFPVDCRHNIKIDRLKLRDMARSGRLQ
ncbi:MAG: peptide synthase [Deltaproteobacteria bacterium]|nr:MAG: peptide synthase [Deltaproteobacteria bacterium]